MGELIGIGCGVVEVERAKDKIVRDEKGICRKCQSAILDDGHVYVAEGKAEEVWLGDAGGRSGEIGDGPCQQDEDVERHCVKLLYTGMPEPFTEVDGRWSYNEGNWIFVEIGHEKGVLVEMAGSRNQSRSLRYMAGFAVWCR